MVEIYSKSRSGTSEDPIVANQRAMFALKEDGREVKELQGFGVQWRSSPQLQGNGMDIQKVSFKLPDWQAKRELQITARILGGKNSGTYKASFVVRPMQPGEEPIRTFMQKIYFDDGFGEYDEAIFEEAKIKGIIKRQSFFFATWGFDGTKQEFEESMGFGEPEPAPVGLPSNKPEIDTEKSNREKALEHIHKAAELLEE